MSRRSEISGAGRTFGLLTTMASTRAQRAAQAYLDDYGLKLAHWPVLLALSDGEPHTQADIAALVDRTTAAVSLVLAEMQREALILRRPNPENRRETLVSLTSLGRRRWEEAAGMAAHVNAIAWSGFTGAEIETLNDLLDRAIGNLDRNADEE